MTEPTRGLLASLRDGPEFGHLRTSLHRLWGALLDTALDKVRGLSGQLEDVTRRGGVLPAAAGAGVAAVLSGRNPVWGVVKGAFAAMSTTTKVLVALAVVVALLLAPVVLVLLLLALLVVAVVAAVRSGPGA
jgi:hypothetical protein